MEEKNTIIILVLPKKMIVEEYKFEEGIDTLASSLYTLAKRHPEIAEAMRTAITKHFGKQEIAFSKN